MTLTKKDEEKIRKIVREEFKLKNKEQHPNYDEWDEESIESDLLNITIATENYWEIDENGEKKELFTWEEAMEIEKKLPDGWRLPTRSEWVILAEEFGVDDNGELDKDIFMQNLTMNYTGYVYGGSVSYPSGDAYYWSRTAGSETLAYYLGFRSGGNFDPQGNSGKYYGFAVRCVKDMEGEE